MTSVIDPLDWRLPIVDGKGAPTPWLLRQWEALRGVLPSPPPVPSEVVGLTLSAAGGTSSFGVAAGRTCDRTLSVLMHLTSALTKTTAAWAPGSAGALDTGVIASGKWYHVFAIAQAGGLSVDALMSRSFSSPTMPSGYVYRRRIGSVLTDGSSNIVGFSQLGSEVLWKVSTTDLNGGAIPSANRGFQALSVPPDIAVEALMRVIFTDSAGSNGLIITAPDTSDQAQTVSNSDLVVNGGGQIDSGDFSRRTNTAQQIGLRAGGAGSNQCYVTTRGWRDTFTADLAP